MPDLEDNDSRWQQILEQIHLLFEGIQQEVEEAPDAPTQQPAESSIPDALNESSSSQGDSSDLGSTPKKPLKRKSAANEEIETAKKRYTESKSELERSRRVLNEERIKNSMENLEARAKRLNKAFENLKKSIKRHKLDINIDNERREQELAEQISEMKELYASIDKSKSQKIDELNTELEELKTKVNEKQKESDEELAELERRKNFLEEQQRLYENKVEQLRINNKNKKLIIQETISNLKESFTLQTRTFDENIAQLNVTRDHLQNEHERIITEKNELQQKLNQEIASLEQDIEEQRRELQYTEQLLAEKKRRLEHDDVVLQKQKCDIEKNESDISLLEEQVNKLRREVQERKEKYDKVNAAKIAEIDENRARLLEEKRRLERDEAASAANVLALQHEIDQETAACSKKIKELKQTEAQLEAKLKVIKNLQLEAETFMSGLHQREWLLSSERAQSEANTEQMSQSCGVTTEQTLVQVPQVVEEQNEQSAAIGEDYHVDAETSAVASLGGDTPDYTSEHQANESFQTIQITAVRKVTENEYINF